MKNYNPFAVVGIRPEPETAAPRRFRWKEKPIISMAVLLVILLGCTFCDCFIPKDPAYMDLLHYSEPPSREFIFGTDAMGRDIFSMIWYGGRISLFIGFTATAISTLAGVMIGAFCGMAPQWLDELLMRLMEILMSVPELLLVIFLQAILGQTDAVTIAVVIGATGWMSIARVVRAETRQIRSSEYVVASRCMGGGFFHVLRRHLAPNFISSIMFMTVMSIRSAIVAESTLSFMGLGLPLEVISWGSMLSLADRALLSRAWWIIVVPGAFLIVTLLCITEIGHYLRGALNHGSRQL